MNRYLPLIPLLLAVGCQRSGTLTTTPGGDAPPGMVLVPAGRFQMGSAANPEKNAPLHPVRVDGFYMDKTEVPQAASSASNSSDHRW